MTVKLKTPSNGSVSLTPQDTASDVVLTVPATTGTVNTSGVVNEVPAGSASAPSVYPTGDANTGLFFPAADTVAVATGGAERYRVDSSGNVGIGTASPSSYASKLVVNGNISLALGGIQYFWDATDSTGTYIKNANNSSLVFGKFGGAEYARFDSSGNLLVGTTDSSTDTAGIKLLASGRIVGVSTSDAVIYRTADDPVIQFRNNNGGTNILKSYITNTGTLQVSSDRKFKKNEEELGSVLDAISRLRPVRFNWLTQADTDPKDWGFIAQEVQEVFPDFVQEREESLLLGKDGFFPVLVKAIQEQQAIINSLQDRIAALENA